MASFDLYIENIIKIAKSQGATIFSIPGGVLDDDDLFPNGDLDNSVGIMVHSSSPIGHGDISVIKGYDGSVIAVRLMKVSSSFLKRMQESHMLYGKYFKEIKTLPGYSDGYAVFF